MNYFLDEIIKNTNTLPDGWEDLPNHSTNTNVWFKPIGIDSFTFCKITNSAGLVSKFLSNELIYTNLVCAKAEKINQVENLLTAQLASSNTPLLFRKDHTIDNNIICNLLENLFPNEEGFAAIQAHLDKLYEDILKSYSLEPPKIEEILIPLGFQSKFSLGKLPFRTTFINSDKTTCWAIKTNYCIPFSYGTRAPFDITVSRDYDTGNCVITATERGHIGYPNVLGYLSIQN